MQIAQVLSFDHWYSYSYHSLVIFAYKRLFHGLKLQISLFRGVQNKKLVLCQLQKLKRIACEDLPGVILLTIRLGNFQCMGFLFPLL